MLPLILGLVLLAIHVHAKGDTFSNEELEKLTKLMAKVRNDLPQEYMLQNRYLIRFLRARNLDQDAAEIMLRKCMKWRKDNNLENILKEDFSNFERKYMFYFTKDREGTPCLVSRLQGIDLRKLILNGKGSDMQRYIYYGFELGMLYFHRTSNESGIEYTSGTLVFNTASYSIRMHACLACLPIWIEFVQVYEACYPQYGKNIIAINAPRILQSLVTIVTPFLNPDTVSSIRLYGHDKNEWTRELLKIFAPESITPEFGGTLHFSKEDLLHHEVRF